MYFSDRNFKKNHSENSSKSKYLHHLLFNVILCFLIIVLDKNFTTF